MRMIFLSDYFYDKFKDCEELLSKENRPYACLSVRLDGKSYAIPIRHHITHQYSFITIDECGLDYTKAVVIEDERYVSPAPAFIDRREWNIIQSGESEIMIGFKRYLNLYRRALRHKEQQKFANVLKYSTLKYFDVD